MWILIAVIGTGIGLSAVGHLLTPQKDEKELQRLEMKGKQGGTGYNVARAVFYSSIVAIKKMGML